MSNTIKIEKRTTVNEKTIKPSLYNVLLKNDDYTTMEFVTEVLQTIFHKSATEAEKTMLTIHFKGIGLCGTYPYEIAETKRDKTHSMAKEQGFPLLAIIEEA